MRHRRIAKHAHDVQQRVGVAERRDVEQRLRAAFAPADTAMSANSTVAGTCLRGIEQRGQRVEPLVGHARDADVGFGLAARAGASRRWSAVGRARSCRRRESNESCAKHRLERGQLPLSQICTS